jgi:hypothetical protein
MAAKPKLTHWLDVYQYDGQYTVWLSSAGGHLREKVGCFDSRDRLLAHINQRFAGMEVKYHDKSLN